MVLLAGQRRNDMRLLHCDWIYSIAVAQHVCRQWFVDVQACLSVCLCLQSCISVFAARELG